MHGIHVSSEIGKLKKVCLHRPGDELLNLTPDTLEELLFDDIPFLPVAQAEHDEFADALRGEGTEVVYLEDLMTETLNNDPSLREKFLAQYIQEAGIATPELEKIAYEALNSISDTKEFVLKTMAGLTKAELGIKQTTATLAGLTDSEVSHLAVNPMPNLYFTRDPFATVGEGVSINRMYSVTRNRETIYGQYIFDNHPEYKGIDQIFNRYAPNHIEGGDILNINGTTLAIGISQRTQAAAIDIIAKNAFWNSQESKIETILAINIPNNRAMMHLDTVFTQIDYDKFTVHPGIFGTLQVFELTKGSKEGEVKITELTDTLENILSKYVGTAVTLIPCAGGDPLAAEREQWNDGSNTLAIAPGVICVYQRNNVTNEILDKAGLNLKVISSAELSRGRGGPRCMSMPFVREDI